MKQKNKTPEKAVEYFKNGYNCSQSVLLAMFEHWNSNNELVPKIATAFGGGIGRCGSLCGALTGGVMALSAKYGTNEPLIEKRLRSYELAKQFYEQFELQNGSVFCRELIGYDLSKPEQAKKARESKTEEKCSGFIRKAVEILLALTENAE